MATTLLINCTAKKTLAPPSELRARSLPRAGVRGLAAEWGRRVRREPGTLQAGQLYRGRSFRETYAACARLGSAIGVVSAGMGVVGVEDSIPPYSLTVTARDADSILSRCSAGDSTSASWWQALLQQDGMEGLSAFFERTGTSLVVLAVSTAYLEMLTDEVASLPAKHLARLRILGPKDASVLPMAVQEYVMPYDGRLNGPDTPMRGTELDFPHRAAVSFLKLVTNDKRRDTAAGHARRVRLSLSHMRPQKRAKRERLTDAAIRNYIRQIKATTNSMAIGLKKLRTSHGVACEQQRFRKLWLGRNA